jgi:hypothetical protein
MGWGDGRGGSDYGATMQFDILKCHGSGNDFPLIDARAIDLDDADWAQVARPGGDGRRRRDFAAGQPAGWLSL